MTLDLRADCPNFVLLDDRSALSKLVFSESGGWDLPLEVQRSLRREWIAEAFSYHYDQCPSYRAYTDRRHECDFAGDDVPLIPTAAFKRGVVVNDLVKTPAAKRCVSSGTQGTQSVVLRDDETLEMLVGSVSTGLRMIGEWYEHELDVINLGPSFDEAQDVWLPYLISLVELFYPTYHAVEDGAFQWAEVVSRARTSIDEGRHVGIVGPPFLVAELAAVVAACGGIDAGENLTVVTAGGWKRHEGEALPREAFAAHVGEAFSLCHPSQIRDAFNQVELNTAIFECGYGRKHIPAWLEVQVRHPSTFELLPYGEVGVLGYLDPTARSFPCFILGEDLGTVEAVDCPCGRIGEVLQVQRRIHRSEGWGCAARISASYGESR